MGEARQEEEEEEVEAGLAGEAGRDPRFLLYWATMTSTTTTTTYSSTLSLASVLCTPTGKMFMNNHKKILHYCFVKSYEYLSPVYALSECG